MVVFGVFFVGVVAFIVVTAVRSRRVLRDAGLDPAAAHAQLAVRLAELDDLHRRGVITAVEHATARTTALNEPR